jgi:hypothetical protein
MRQCHVCYNKWPDEVEVCPKDHVPLALGRDAARLHFDPYSADPANINTIESALRNLEEVLAASPSHAAAAKVKKQLERALPEVKARADDLFRSAEERFAAGDLAGCLEILVDNPPMLRKEQAADLRRRVRQSIADGAKAKPDDEKARRLAVHLYDNLCGYFVEGPGGIDWLRALSEGLAEVLFLFPGHTQAASMKKDIDSSFAKVRAESEDRSKTGEGPVGG